MAEIAIMKVHRQDQYRDLARRLKQAGRGDLQRRMTREIRKAGQPALTAVQAKFRGVDMTSQGSGGYSSGLRARVAKATRISILGSGIRIRVEPKKVAPTLSHGRTLSFGVNGKKWRHPVFGNRKVWTNTNQHGQPVFYSTLLAFEPRWRAGIDRAMDETERELLGG